MRSPQALKVQATQRKKNRQRRISEDLAIASSSLRSFLDFPAQGSVEPLRSIPVMLDDIRAELLEADTRLARSSINESRLAMQYNIAHILAETTTISKAAPQVMRLICETAGWEYGSLWSVEYDTATLTNKGIWFAERADLSAYAEQVRFSYISQEEESLPGSVIHAGEPLWVSNLSTIDSDYARRVVAAGLQVGYVLPVKRGRRVVAVLECYSDHPQVQDQQLVSMLTAVANQVGVFIERKILEETLEQRLNQQRLLADVGLALSTSVDLKTRFMNITHVIVPELADWCAVDTIDKNGFISRVAAAHVENGKESLLYELQPPHKIDIANADNSRAGALTRGESLIMSEISPAVADAAYPDDHRRAIVRKLNPVSTMIVPLIAHNQILGIFTFVHSDSGRHYSQPDLALAEDIVRRMSLALDNAFLFDESQRLNAELEQRVETRTAQLKAAVDELTNQIAERQNAEEQVRVLNRELEIRIAERTSQLEKLNIDLNKELADRKKTGDALKTLLKRTRELYRISQTIGMVRTPMDVLGLLLSSSYLKDVSRASIAILEHPWLENEPAPERCYILTELNKGRSQPSFLSHNFTLEEYGVKLPVPYGQPIMIPDIQSMIELPDDVRSRFKDLRTHSLIILPLIANGEFYGLLSLHFKTRRMTTLDDLRHMRGLVDESALVIQNMRLLEAESLARREAERANELKLKFLGMISHELRTPLTSIKGFVTTLLADDVVWSPEKQREFLETIDAESDKLHELIEQLLDLSRMEAGILRISPEPTSLDKVLESASSQLQALTAEHTLVLDVPSQLPPLLGDEQRLAQVITNLVSNAAKFSPPETTICVRAYQQGQDIQVDVLDEGPGISAVDREHVFTAFRQLETSGENRKKGAGLGLAICRGLVEAHHGRIWIQDHDGPGTTFSFTLPIMGSSASLQEA